MVDWADWASNVSDAELNQIEAGGKILRGLVRRRAEEKELFDAE